MRWWIARSITLVVSSGVRFASGVLVVLVLVSGCMIPLQRPVAYNHWTAQRRAADRLLPIQPQPPERAATKVTTLRVRAWADQEYRKRPRWRHQLEGLIAEANNFLRAGFGIELATDIRVWERPMATADLPASLGELAALDNGDDVDLVLGLVGSLETVTIRHDDLGIATILGKHLLVRDMNNAAEARAIDETFPALSTTDRRDLYAVRLQHKRLLVMLHELLHCFGAHHEAGRNWIMSPIYANDSAELSDATVRLITLGIAYHLAADEGARIKLAGEIATYLRDTDWPAWEQESREAVARRLTRASPGAEDRPMTGSKDTLAARPPALGGEDARRWAKAVTAAAEGRHADAWPVLLALAGQYPYDRTVLLLACQVAAQPGLEAPEGRTVCASAAELVAADPRPLLARARIEIGAGAPAAAQPFLADAAARLATLSGQGSLWSELAGLALAIGAVSLAEQAALEMGQPFADETFRAGLAAARRQVGLPPDAARFKVLPEREAAYAATVRAGYQQLAAGTLDEAARLANQAAREFPGAPGPLTVLCGVELYRGRPARARRLCDQALSSWDECVFAHFYAGQATMASGRRAEAARHLERAVELAPTEDWTWTTLASFYEVSGDKAKLAALREQYRTRFRRALDRQ